MMEIAMNSTEIFDITFKKYFYRNKYLQTTIVNNHIEQYSTL